MVLLSSKATFYYKRVFPVTFFGFLLLFIGVGLFLGLRTGDYPPLPFFIGPVLMIGFTYFILKMLVFDLVDQVFDLGDALLIRNGGKEDRVALADIVNVNYSALVNPARATLTLRKPSLFGSEVTFSPPMRLIPYTRHPAMDKLIARIDAARRNST